jgi:hypothetical protein
MKYLFLLLFSLFFLTAMSHYDPEILYLNNGKILIVTSKWKESEDIVGYYEKDKGGPFYINEKEIDYVTTEQKRKAKAREEFLNTPPVTPGPQQEKLGPFPKQNTIGNNHYTPSSETKSIENEINEFAKREYPNDSRMQEYTYKKQIAAYNYLLTVEDSDVKEFAAREYPHDYVMQKYTYDKQLAAKRYMQTVGDAEVKEFSVREYPYDYVMQKYTYDKQLAAKNYMDSVTNQGAKNSAIREYPYDYSMQKYTYDKLAY